MRALERIWEAAATLLWALPLLLFLALHARTPPAPPAQLAVATLALLGLAAPRTLGERYFRTRRWEADGELYRALGVRSFGRWVPRGAVMNRMARRRHRHRAAGLAASDALRSPIADAGGCRALELATRASERTHAWWLLMTAALTVWAGAIGAWRAAALLVVLNITFNVYPILLQRETRARLCHVARRTSARRQRAAT